MNELTKLQNEMQIKQDELRHLESLNQEIRVINSLLFEARDAYKIYLGMLNKVYERLKANGVEVNTVSMSNYPSLKYGIRSFTQVEGSKDIIDTYYNEIIDPIVKELSKNE